MRTEESASKPVKKCSVLAMYTNSDASTIVRKRNRTGWDRSLGKTPRKHQQSDFGKDIQGAT